MAADGDLYQRDFWAWTQAQADALRLAARSTNVPVDWENVVEEIETLGRSERRELVSRIATIIEHLLKLSLSPAELPRRGWIDTVRSVRFEVQDVLDENPSLRDEVPAIVAREMPKAARLVADVRDDGGELTPDLRARLRTADFAPEQVLGKWLPGASR